MLFFAIMRRIVHRPYWGRYLGRFLCALTCAWWWSVSLAWGAAGHRMVAEVAEHHLTPQARAWLAGYLEGYTLEQLSTWPDDWKRQPHFPASQLHRNWHYAIVDVGIDTPLGAAMVAGLGGQTDSSSSLLREHGSHLQEGIVWAESELRVSADHAPEDNRRALAWLVHLMGDLHQPLHVTDGRYHGGLACRLQWRGRDGISNTNFHHLWDDELLMEVSRGQVASYVVHLDHLADDHLTAWQVGNPADWMREVYGLRNDIYPGGRRHACASSAARHRLPLSLDRRYALEHQALLDAQLAKAGLRLAERINRLSKQQVQPEPYNLI